jgi:hypothetical protein
MKQKPNISKRAFWDTPIVDEDFDKYPDYIIGRVFEFGTMDELFEIIKYYGEDKCKNAIQNAKFLRMNALNIASLLFNIPRESIKCFKNRPSHIPF